jgi:hypothetical protein
MDHGNLELAQHPLSTSERNEHYERALAAFTIVLDDVESSNHVAGPTPPKSRGSAPSALTDDAFSEPLLVHLAALQDAANDPIVLANPDSTGTTRDLVLGAYVGREVRRWQALAAVEIPPLSESDEVLRRAVVLACLSNPRAPRSGEVETKAAELLRHVPELSGDSDNGRRFRLARWLHRLHPGPDYWNPLRPDPIADQLIAELDILPRLVGGLLQFEDGPTLDRMFTELVRASAGAGGTANLALVENIIAQLDKALDAAAAHPEGPIPQRLLAALQRTPAGPAAAILYGRLPGGSLLLAGLAAVISEQAVIYLRQGAMSKPAVPELGADLAAALNNYALRLHDLGQVEAALGAVEEAVTILRGLEKTAALDVLPDLARAMINRSACLTSLGRREEAVGTGSEAVSMLRGLAADHPEVFQEELGRALLNQADQLSGLARREAALGAAAEAVKIFGELASTRPEKFQPDFAAALSGESKHLYLVNRYDQSLVAANKAITRYRALASSSWDRHGAGLALALTRRANCLESLNRGDEALTSASESVSMYRRLAALQPEAFRPFLALALHNQSPKFASAGRNDEALSAAEESIGIYRELASAHPRRYRLDLAKALSRRALRLSAMGRPADALADAAEAVLLLNGLAAQEPDSYNEALSVARNVEAHIRRSQ